MSNIGNGNESSVGSEYGSSSGSGFKSTGDNGRHGRGRRKDELDGGEAPGVMEGRTGGLLRDNDGRGEWPRNCGSGRDGARANFAEP